MNATMIYTTAINAVEVRLNAPQIQDSQDGTKFRCRMKLVGIMTLENSFLRNQSTHEFMKTVNHVINAMNDEACDECHQMYQS